MLAGIPVFAQLTFVIQPLDRTVNPETDVFFVVSVTGGTLPYTYEWRQDGDLIVNPNVTGQNADTLFITGAVPPNEGSYTCNVTDSDFPNNNGTSGAANLVINKCCPEITPGVHFPYCMDFESSWDAYWAYSSSTSTGRIEISNSRGLPVKNGSSHLLMDNNTIATWNSNDVKLYVDFTGETELKLTFWVQDYNNPGTWNNSYNVISFSDDGGVSWQSVFPIYSGQMIDAGNSGYNVDTDGNDTAWYHHTLDVEYIARAHSLELNEDFVIKFNQYGDNPIYGPGSSNSGLAFDDICIYQSDALTFAGVPYSTSFEHGFDRYWYMHSDRDLTEPGDQEEYGRIMASAYPNAGHKIGRASCRERV